MGLDRDLVTQFRDELTCTLCHRLFDNPTLFPGCNHAFCYECVLQTLEGPGITASQCPTCKHPGWKNELKPVHTLQSLAGILRSILTQTGLPVHMVEAENAAKAGGGIGGSCKSESGKRVAGQSSQALAKEPKRDHYSKAKNVGSGDRKRKAGRAQQQGLDITPNPDRVQPAEGELPRKQVRFADTAAGSSSSAAAAPLHVLNSMHNDLASAAPAAEVAEHSAAACGDLAGEAPDMADDGWEVPNTFPLDPHGSELLPSEPPASPITSPACLNKRPGCQRDAEPPQEGRCKALWDGSIQREQAAALKSGATDDQKSARVSVADVDRQVSSGGASAKSGDGFSKPEAGRAKLAKRGRTAPHLAAAVTRSSKRQAPRANQARQAGNSEGGAMHAGDVAADDDFQEEPDKPRSVAGTDSAKTAAQRPGKAGEQAQKRGAGGQLEPKLERAAGAQARERDVAKRQLPREVKESKGAKIDGPKPRRGGWPALKEAAAKAEARKAAKREDAAFVRLFTAEAALVPTPGDTASRDAVAAPIAGSSRAAKEPQERPSSAEEVPGTESADAGQAIVADKVASAAEKLLPPHLLPAAAAGNATDRDVLRRDPDGHSSAATPSKPSADGFLNTTVLYERHPEQQRVKDGPRRQNWLEHGKLEEADALTVPDTPHADVAPARRCRNRRTPLRGPGDPPAPGKPAEAAGSRAALSAMDINALGARLAEQVVSPKCTEEAEALEGTLAEARRMLQEAERMCRERGLLPPSSDPAAPSAGGPPGDAGVNEAMEDLHLEGGLPPAVVANRGGTLGLGSTLGLDTFPMMGTERSLAEIDEALLARGYMLPPLDTVSLAV